jgi:HPt (histidine-containing phosphotransfer) domain-containing protein
MAPGEWEDDPELMNLRLELIESFAERKSELDARTADFARARAAGDAEAAQRALLAVHVVVHKLAGAASSYGLRALGSLAEALDDLLGMELASRGESQLDRLPARSALLSRALAEAHAAKGDAPAVASSPEGRKLISDAGSILSEASSGSSSDQPPSRRRS